MPCLFSCLFIVVFCLFLHFALLAFMPCYYHALPTFTTYCYYALLICALLLLCLVVLRLAISYFAICTSVFCALLLHALCYSHTLLFSIVVPCYYCALLFVPCCSHFRALLLVAFVLVLLPPHHALLLTICKYLLSPPSCWFVAFVAPSHALLLSCFVVLRLAISHFAILHLTILCLVAPRLVVLFSQLVVFYCRALLLLCLAICALLLSLSCFATCCFCSRVAALPPRLVAHHLQVPLTPPKLLVRCFSCSLSCFATLPCQLVFPPHSFA
jgi:hypothetical protein